MNKKVVSEKGLNEKVAGPEALEVRKKQEGGTPPRGARGRPQKAPFLL